MRVWKVKVYRVSDGSETTVTRLLPQNETDELELERLDKLGLLSRGDTFAEQREHEKLQEERLSEHAQQKRKHKR